jgi:S-adenosylmethionine:tRNA ribosyltransferase-isomerase
MRPATWPRERPLEERLLAIDPRLQTYEDARIGDLPRWFRAGDALVVNDAATLPASLPAVSSHGHPVEVRLSSRTEEGAWVAVLLGPGDWRMRTEDRPPPEPVATGDTLAFDGGLRATITALTPLSRPLVELHFNRSGHALWADLYRLGRPVQYSYLRGPLALWHVQNRFAERPWAAESPSAGRPLTWELLLALGRKGVHLLAVTHATGLSSTGDPELDARLPLPERFEIPEETVRTLAEVKARGGRVVAVGTSVVRALEGCAALHGGRLVAGGGTTDLLVGRTTRLRVVDGLFTGMHEPTTSHFELLQAFSAPDLLRAAYGHAESQGYLCHEFGDSNLILAS